MGFEPTVQSPVHTLSRRANSATLAPLRAYVNLTPCGEGYKKNKCSRTAEWATSILDFYFKPEYLPIGLGALMSTDDFDSTFDDDQFDEFEKQNIDEEIKRLRKEEPTFSSIAALEEIIDYFMSQDKYEDALYFANKLIAVMPASGENLARRGEIHEALGKFENALEDYSKRSKLTR